MISLLAKWFIKKRDKTDDPSVREAYGVLCGAAGILLNLLLFGGKLVAGALSGSIAITSDAFNNLSDAGSSVITLLGFRMAGQKPDVKHPFGHGRIEYLSGLMVSILILLMGIELLKSAVGKIAAPEAVVFSPLTFAILGASVLVKLYMVFYNRKYAKLLHSDAMQATAIDSLSDSVATTVVMISMLIGHFTGLKIDGWCGLLVSLFILYSGFDSAKTTISPLLGQPPSEEFVREIEACVCAHQEIIGMHDLIVHDYGPGRRMVSLHAEVPAEADLELMHDAVDNIEQELRSRLSCHAVIHMDPIHTEDEATNRLKKEVAGRLGRIGEDTTLHDFRCVVGPTHKNLIFDVVVPYKNPKSDAEIRACVDEIVAEVSPDCRAVIEIDRPYVTYTK